MAQARWAPAANRFAPDHMRCAGERSVPGNDGNSWFSNNHASFIKVSSRRGLSGSGTRLALLHFRLLRFDDDRRHRARAPVVARHEAAANQAAGDHRGYAADIAQRAEVTRAPVVFVARLDRDRDRADAALRRLDQDFALEHEAAARQRQRQFDDGARIETLPALRIDHALAAGPGNPEVRLLV